MLNVHVHSMHPVEFIATYFLHSYLPCLFGYQTGHLDIHVNNNFKLLSIHQVTGTHKVHGPIFTAVCTLNSS